MGAQINLGRAIMASFLSNELGRLRREALRQGMKELAHLLAVSQKSARETALGEVSPLPGLPDIPFG